MCIGIPMQVESCNGLIGVCTDLTCEGTDYQHQTNIDMSLVGEQPKGTWVLVFLGAAREVLSDDDAKQTLNAVRAMQSIMQGNMSIDHLFSDLIKQPPQLPEHLKAQVDAQTKGSK